MLVKRARVLLEVKGPQSSTPNRVPHPSWGPKKETKTAYYLILFVQ